MKKNKIIWDQEISDINNIDKSILEIFPPFITHNKTPTNFNDLTGHIFGKLKVLYRGENYNKWGVTWICQCSCEQHTIIKVRSCNLVSGNTNSCGCYGIEKIKNTCKKYNQYDLTGEYGIGWTSNTNQPFYFDLEDYDKIKDYCWYFSKRGYIEARSNGKLIKMHRIIMGATNPHIKVDHKFHDENGAPRTYDNRKFNLRLCTQQKNACNSKIRTDNTSGVTGVEHYKDRDAWQARITYNNKEYYLGSFKNKEDAIAARQKKEIELFGEFQYKEYNEVFNE